MIFFSRVLHNENHVLHLLLVLKRNDCGYELRRHERGLFLRPSMTNAVSYTDSYINTGHNFPPANFLCLIAICQFIIPGKRICCCAICINENAQVCTATIVFKATSLISPNKHESLANAR